MGPYKGLLWAHNWLQSGPTLLTVGQPKVWADFGLAHTNYSRLDVGTLWVQLQSFSTQSRYTHITICSTIALVSSNKSRVMFFSPNNLFIFNNNYN